MMVATFVIATLFAAVPSDSSSDDEISAEFFQPTSFIDLFKTHEHRYTGGQYQDELFKYLLFVPRNLKSGERCPLLVWLHGFRENGLDDQRSLRWLDLILADSDHIEKYRFFILVVQCPPENSSWFRSMEDSPDDMLTVAYDVLQKTMREQPIDPDRVYLSGVSSGAGGCWEMAMRYPDVFAAVVPMASSGGDVSRVEKLKNIPIWVFHNIDDKDSSPAGDMEMTTAIEMAGGNVHLTLCKGRSHDCWNKAFQMNVMDWMLEQRRGSICWTPPGCQPWKWWHLGAVPCAFIVLVWLEWYWVRRRRK